MDLDLSHLSSTPVSWTSLSSENTKALNMRYCIVQLQYYEVISSASNIVESRVVQITKNPVCCTVLFLSFRKCRKIWNHLYSQCNMLKAFYVYPLLYLTIIVNCPDHFNANHSGFYSLIRTTVLVKVLKMQLSLM